VRSAEEYLDGLRDGREVYYRGERVADVVEHQ
jgi:aromatic ring hydroxylase